MKKIILIISIFLLNTALYSTDHRSERKIRLEPKPQADQKAIADLKIAERHKVNFPATFKFLVKVLGNQTPNDKNKLKYNKLSEVKKNGLPADDIIAQILPYLVSSRYKHLKKFSYGGSAGSIDKILELRDGNILTSHFYRGIKIWNPTTGEHIRSFYGTATTQTTVARKNQFKFLIQLSDDILATASFDGTIRTWKISTGECLITFTNDASEIYSLIKLDSGYLASAANNKTIKIWNPMTGECIKIIPLSESASSLIELNNANLAVACKNTIVILNKNSKEILEIKCDEADEFHLAIRLRNGNLAWLSRNARLLVLNSSTWKVIALLKVSDHDSHFPDYNNLVELSDGKLAYLAYSSFDMLNLDSRKMKSLNFTVRNDLLPTIEDSVHSVTELANGTFAVGYCGETMRLWKPTLDIKASPKNSCVIS